MVSLYLSFKEVLFKKNKNYILEARSTPEANFNDKLHRFEVLLLLFVQ